MARSSLRPEKLLEAMRAWRGPTEGPDAIFAKRIISAYRAGLHSQLFLLHRDSFLHDIEYELVTQGPANNVLIAIETVLFAVSFLHDELVPQIRARLLRSLERSHFCWHDQWRRLIRLLLVADPRRLVDLQDVLIASPRATWPSLIEEMLPQESALSPWLELGKVLGECRREIANLDPCPEYTPSLNQPVARLLAAVRDVPAEERHLVPVLQRLAEDRPRTRAAETLWQSMVAESSNSAYLQRFHLRNGDDPAFDSLLVPQQLRQLDELIEGALKAPLQQPIRPRWDSESHKLFVIRHPNQGRNLELILSVFQEAAWAEIIDDPLPGNDRVGSEGSVARINRLEGVIKSLNRGLRRLRFHTRSGGTQISWSWQLR